MNEQHVTLNDIEQKALQLGIPFAGGPTGSLWTRVKLDYREQWRVLVQAIREATATQEVGAVETSRSSSAAA